MEKRRRNNSPVKWNMGSKTVSVVVNLQAVMNESLLVLRQRLSVAQP